MARNVSELRGQGWGGAVEKFYRYDRRIVSNKTTEARRSRGKSLSVMQKLEFNGYVTFAEKRLEGPIISSYSSLQGALLLPRGGGEQLQELGEGAEKKKRMWRFENTQKGG